MEKVSDILNYGSGSDSLVDAWSKRLGSPQSQNSSSNNNTNNSNLILQLGCSDPTQLKSCIERTLRDYSTALRGINLNCGCPSIESGGSSMYGAKLMNDVDLSIQLVRSMKEATMAMSSLSPSSSSSLCEYPPPEISVKCRIGVIDSVGDMDINMDMDNTAYNGNEEQMTKMYYEQLYNYIASVKEAGADHVIIHARPAVLSGLSPVKNRTVPKLNHGIVYKIASDFCHDNDFRITLNGGITSLAQLEQLMDVEGKFNGDGDSVTATAADQRRYVSSHMAGRWCLRRPLDLVGVESLLVQEKEKQQQQQQQRQRQQRQSQSLRCENKKKPIGTLNTQIEEYIDYAIQMASIPPRKQEITTAELCLPLYLITEQLREDYESLLYHSEGGGYEKVVENLNPNPKPTTLLTSNEIEGLYGVMCSGMTELQHISSKGKKLKTKDQPKENDVNFKRLSNCFKPIVGTKVVNKWKRNRNEL